MKKVAIVGLDFMGKAPILVYGLSIIALHDHLQERNT